ncbi:MAG: hypothetical protein ABEN55_19580 [Bradymonadaceae bacterium]
MTRSDLLVPLPWFGVWCVFVGATYTTSRELGASRTNSWLAAAAAGFVPAVSAAIFVAYVDNLVAALVLLAAAFFTRGERDEQLVPLLCAIASLAAAFVVKKTAIPYVGMGTLIFWGLVFRDHAHQWGKATVGYLLLTLALIGPPTIYLWTAEGSPLYPWGISIGDFVLFEGRDVAARVAGEQKSAYPTALFVKQLLYHGYGGFPLSHINYGPFGPVWFGLGLWGFAGVMRNDSSRRWTVTAFGIASLFLLYQVLQSVNHSATNVARYSAAVPALCLSLAATRTHRAVRYLLGLGLAIQLVFWLPTNWSLTDTKVAGFFALTALPFALVAGLLLLWGRGKSWPRPASAAGGAAVALLICAATTLEPIRSTFRYDLYREAALGRIYTNHPVYGNHARSFPSSPIWKYLDKLQSPSKIAVTVGWDTRGINWFVYPFFGRRLQNDLTYVPITEDGSKLPLRQKRQRLDQADPKAWFHRLKRRDIEYVAALAPRPVEVSLMDESGGFKLVRYGLTKDNRLYRVRHDVSWK